MKWNICVDSGRRLAYANEILRYEGDKTEQKHVATYETDLLIYDARENDRIPRVVVECKKGNVTTHDALTYRAKAATHKHVHPYLRYGILIGDFGSSIPGRLIRHGAYFDLMMVWSGQNPSDKEWSELTSLLKDEIQASRTLHQLAGQPIAKPKKGPLLSSSPSRIGSGIAANQSSIRSGHG